MHDKQQSLFKEMRMPLLTLLLVGVTGTMATLTQTPQAAQPLIVVAVLFTFMAAGGAGLLLMLSVNEGLLLLVRNCARYHVSADDTDEEAAAPAPVASAGSEVAEEQPTRVDKMPVLYVRVGDGRWAQVRANHARLDACAGPHDFSIIARQVGELVRDWRCTRCGGELEAVAASWYRKGLAHGRGQGRDEQ